MMVHRTHPHDRHMGQRLRLARLVKGMSQSRLGDAVQITYQQIQKYEKGAHRISASRLSQFATILGVDIGYFFESAEGHTDAGHERDSDALVANLSRADVAILKGISKIEDGKLKRKLLDLIVYVAAH